MRSLTDHFVTSAWTVGIFQIGTRWIREDHDAQRIASEIASQCDGYRTPEQIIAAAAAEANAILWERINAEMAGTAQQARV